MFSGLVGLLSVGQAMAQQVLAERVLHQPNLNLAPATAALAPNGECVLTAGAYQPNTTGSRFTNLLVARVNPSTCDTLWQRCFSHQTLGYSTSAVAADAKSVWVLTDDTVYTPGVWKGVRLWRFSSRGRLRGIVRPRQGISNSVGEQATALLMAPGGRCHVAVARAFPFPIQQPSPSLLRFDSTLTLLGRRDYRPVNDNELEKITYSPAGNILMLGTGGYTPATGNKVKVMEADPTWGDSLRGAYVAAPTGYHQLVNNYNARPCEIIGLVGGGYALTADESDNTGSFPTSAILKLDANYNLLWRYMRPFNGLTGDIPAYTQVRELADGTLLALVREIYNTRGTYHLDRLNPATGALIATYTVNPSLTVGRQIIANYLLPVAADSTLLIVGSGYSTTGPTTSGIYVARIRIPNLPRIVTAPVTFPTATRGEVAGAGLWLGQPYPNPARGPVRLPYRLPAGAVARLEVCDALGRRVQQRALPATAGPAELTLAGLSPGLYLLRLVGAAGAASQRLVVE